MTDAAFRRGTRPAAPRRLARFALGDAVKLSRAVDRQSIQLERCPLQIASLSPESLHVHCAPAEGYSRQ
jgi:hypothetical protein